MGNAAHNIVADALGRAPTDVPESGHFSLVAGWDSLTHMRIILAIEARLGRDLTPAEMLAITSVEDIGALLEKKRV